MTGYLQVGRDIGFFEKKITKTILVPVLAFSGTSRSFSCRFIAAEWSPNP
jgi:hypothetical protein